MGVGHSLMEELILDGSGRIVNLGAMDYRIPTIQDIPRELHSVLIENEDGPGPYGAKGAGEGGILGIGGAIGAAVNQAVGRHDSRPAADAGAHLARHPISPRGTAVRDRRSADPATTPSNVADPITQRQRLSLRHLEWFAGDDARVDHPDVARVVPRRRGIRRVVDDGAPDRLAVRQRNQIRVPVRRRPVEIGGSSSEGRVESRVRARRRTTIARRSARARRNLRMASGSRPACRPASADRSSRGCSRPPPRATTQSSSHPSPCAWQSSSRSGYRRSQTWRPTAEAAGVDS